MTSFKLGSNVKFLASFLACHPLERGVHCDWQCDCIFKISSFVHSTDLALKKTTAQSSTDYNGFSSRAVDGNLGPYYGSKSCTHTKKEQYPWWRVDLGREYIVTGVWCKAMFTELYWIDFALARKAYIIGRGYCST